MVWQVICKNFWTPPPPLTALSLLTNQCQYTTQAGPFGRACVENNRKAAPTNLLRGDDLVSAQELEDSVELLHAKAMPRRQVGYEVVVVNQRHPAHVASPHLTRRGNNHKATGIGPFVCQRRALGYFSECALRTPHLQRVHTAQV